MTGSEDADEPIPPALDLTETQVGGFCVGPFGGSTREDARALAATLHEAGF